MIWKLNRITVKVIYFCSGLSRNENPHCHVLTVLYSSLTNSNVLERLAISDLNNWVTEELRLVDFALTNINNELYCYSNEFPNHVFCTVEGGELGHWCELGHKLTII